MCIANGGDLLLHRVVARLSFSREATYVYQLRAFIDNILEDTPVLTTPADALANMRVIDAIYEKAGLWLRGRADTELPTH